MATSTYQLQDSPENLSARRRGLEVLPIPAQRRVGVLGFAIRASDAMPGSVEPIADTAKITVSSDLSAESNKNVVPTAAVDGQSRPTVSRSILDEAYKMLDNIWSNN